MGELSLFLHVLDVNIGSNAEQFTFRPVCCTSFQYYCCTYSRTFFTCTPYLMAVVRRRTAGPAAGIEEGTVVSRRNCNKFRLDVPALVRILFSLILENVSGHLEWRDIIITPEYYFCRKFERIERSPQKGGTVDSDSFSFLCFRERIVNEGAPRRVYIRVPCSPRDNSKGNLRLRSLCHDHLNRGHLPGHPFNGRTRFRISKMVELRLGCKWRTLI